MSVQTIQSESFIEEKRRITVLLDRDGRSVEEKVVNRDGVITIPNQSGHVQDRAVLFVPQLASRPDFIHISWKRNAEADITPIKSYIPYGFNIFTNSSGSIAKFIDTPVGKVYYSDTFEDNALSKWFPPEFVDQLLRYSEDNDLDITVTRGRVEVNRYYELTDDNLFPLNGTESVKTEAGIFQVDTEDDTDTSLSGLRCTWHTGSGAINKCQRTLFFYNQIYADKSSLSEVSLTLSEPVNLHPVVQIDLTSKRPIHNCEYYAYFNLPKYFFIDQFQSIPTLLFGEHDLELPEYKLSGFGSISLFTLQPGSINEVTLHSRYIKPTNDGSAFFEAAFTPQVFYACDTSIELTKRSPFYTGKIGYEHFFTDNTKFYYLNSTKMTINLPKLDSSDNLCIQLFTLGLVLFSVLYLIRKLF